MAKRDLVAIAAEEADRDSLTADFCEAYGYEEVINNPAYVRGSATPEIPARIPNPESREEFMGRIVREFIGETIANVRASKVVKTAEAAARAEAKNSVRIEKAAERAQGAGGGGR